MKRVAILGFALVAILALSAGSAAASKIVVTGHAPFTASSGLSKLSSTEVLPEIECKSSEAEGQLTSATHGEVTVTFKECATEAKKCGNVSPGTIKTKLLETTLGWINKAKGEAGVDFIGKAGGETTKGAEAEFECEGLAVAVKGSVIGRSTPNNTMATEGKVTLVGKGGNQEVEKFEGGVKDTLLTEASLAPGLTLNSAQNQTATETFSQVKAMKGSKEIMVPDPVELNTLNNPATPEQGRCYKTKGGKYKDANCSELPPEKKGKPGKGKYEFFPIT
jgi:hypothetical protein